MQSRSRKYRKSFDNYQQAIQKQLHDDFQVHQYLNQNKLEDNNIDEYLKLYDSLQVTNNKKKKKYQSLKVNYIQMTSDPFLKTFQNSQSQNWSVTKQSFQAKYEEAQIKIYNQNQIKNNLWKQILETKKSLNLLKGDIGHLVSRNQSAKLLQSKISKVKIVADDQLKRVSSAFTKDKQQFKIRGQMQKKFNKKLKNVSVFQDNTLDRMKKNYLETMMKKKQIHDRLNYIERVSSSIKQSSDKQKAKNQTNRRTLELYKHFVRLVNLISKIPEIQQKYVKSQLQIHQYVQWIRNVQNYNQNTYFDCLESNLTKSRKTIPVNLQINSQVLQVITKEKLIQFQSIIKQQYARITGKIQKKTSEYNIQIQKSQQILTKLEECDQQIQKIQYNISNQIGIKFILTKQIRQNYQQKLKKFIRMLKTIYTVLEYIQKNINYSCLQVDFKRKISNDSQKSFVYEMNNQNTSKDNEKLKIPFPSKHKISSEKTLTQINKNYISQLHKIYYILLKDQDSQDKLQSISQNVLYDLNNDIQNWLFIIKQNLRNGVRRKVQVLHQNKQKNQKVHKNQKHFSKLRDSRISQLKPKKVGVQTQQQQIKQQAQFSYQNYSRHHTVYRQDNISRPHSYSNSSSLNQSRYIKTGLSSVNRNSGNSFHSSKLINLNKLKKFQLQGKKAQRIKFLQDVDKDYYKMLKSTLKMQKQNTRKNYQFLNTFKRAKYSSQDEILEQKRFQCSFSMLFAGNKNKLMSQKNQLNHKKSIFFKNNKNQNRISRLNQSKNLIQSSNIIQNQVYNIDLNLKKMKQLKENIQKMKQKSNKQKIKSTSKHNLSIQLKDIINLV